ncbi:methyl-accepting chemotaxis protein [Paracerasibacillus soli]|uniref:hypothetical protein n=1 Tax=Paracerasibacillus soli TaxID=480284 RepID=UPI00387E115C
MVHNINENFNATNTTVVEVKSAMNQVSHHSSQINASIDEISRGAIHSSEAIQTTVEEIETATQLAEQVQEKADTSKDKSVNMVHTLRESTEVVNRLVQGIQQLADEQEASLQGVTHLKENALQVESIISMVGEISEQTTYSH